MTIKKDLEAVRAQKREIIKEEKRLKAQEKLADGLERWKHLTALKGTLEAQLSNSKHARGYNLTKLGKMQRYYTLQNPNNKKQKAMSKDAEWVKDYLSKGGNEADLISQADKTRMSAWKRMNPRKRRNPNILSDKPSNKISSGKSAAIKQQGIG